MFKKLFYRSCALVSELEDTLHHLYRWHRTKTTSPRDRVLDMYALEDRVLFNIAPVMNLAALQAAGGGTGTGQDVQATTLLAADQTATATTTATFTTTADTHSTQASQNTEKVSQAADNSAQISQSSDNTSTSESADIISNSTDTNSSQTEDQAGVSNQDKTSTERHVNFALIDDSLQNLDQLISALKSDTEYYIYDHLMESANEVLGKVYNWALKQNAQIDTLSIFSHGISGSFELGNKWLTTTNLADSATAWQQLGTVMTANSKIDVYGCNVAAQNSGQELINEIGKLSGVSVFASTDYTGYSGDWILEAVSVTGNASTWQNSLDTELLAHWKYELDTAHTVYVTTTSDVIDGNVSSIELLNANQGIDGVISLREAILAANNTTNATGDVDRIYFNISGTGVQTITVSASLGALPNITDGVIIDGYTQSDASANTLAVGNDAVLRIELNGSATTGASGLTLDTGSSGSTICGLIINSFDVTGINILTNNNTISGNFIGTNAAGTAALGNSYGIYVLNGQYNTIGGTTAAARNVISGNTTEGIYLNNASFNTITGNYIGTNYDGTAAIGNNIGIYVYSATGTVIGGTTAAAANVISGNTSLVDNTSSGIYMYSCASGNVIQGNYIGTNAAGTGAIANRTGIIVDNTSGLVIGGSATGAGNVICQNTYNGVNISNDSTSVRVWGNSIYSNGGLGIDLGGDGVTTNDTGVKDSDTGPNDLQNYPLLTSAAINGTTLMVRGTLDSVAETTFRIEVFANSAADGSGYGEGQQFIGSFTIITDATGNYSFSNTFTNVTIADGAQISATATNLTSNSTSEFSACITAVTPGIIVTPTSGLVTTEGGQATFTVVLACAPTADVTINLSSSDTSEGKISSLSSPTPGQSLILTFTTANWSTPQTVTVSGVDDYIIDGNIAYTIVTAAADSSDPIYSGLNPSDVSVTNNNSNTYNTIWVTTNTDANDGGDTSSIVALNATPGTNGISLREAIIAANNTPNGADPDRICFDLPDGSHTITPSEAYPNITQAVVIDGTSDSHYSGTPIIEIDGTTSNYVGLWLDVGSDGSTLRGLVLNRHGWEGIRVDSNDNIIAGCYVGTDVTGTTAQANGARGASALWILGNNNRIGGTTAADRNVISGNTRTGVWLSGTNNTVQGNYIGTDYTGTIGIANGWDGVTISGSNNLVGGTDASMSNLIAYNANYGVAVQDGCSGNQILGNSIYGHSSIGIDLRPNTGLTPNDTGDTDTGGNNLQNFPVLSTATANSSQVYITGSLNSTAITTFRIEFFANSTSVGPDSTGYGEGQRYLGYKNVTTDENGNVTFDALLTASVSDGEYISATATNQTTYDTSEFAQDIVAHRVGITVTPTSGLTTSETGGTAQFSVVLDAVPTANVTIALSSSDTTEGTIALATLNFTTSDWNVAQYVTITGVDDPINDGNIAYTIVTAPAGSTDPLYNGLNALDVSVTNLDNEIAGITVSPPSALITNEKGDGNTTTFTVVLNCEPTAEVKLNLSSTNTTEGVLSGATLVDGQLTFTPGNWNQAQTVTLTGVDDFIAADVNYTINISVDTTHSASEYASVLAQAITATNRNVDETYNIINVDTTSDTNDTGLDPNTMTVAQLYNQKGTDGQISLREAIIAANNTPNASPSQPDRIYFNLPVGSQITIAAASTQLPDISTPMIIDGNNGSTTATSPSIILYGKASTIGLRVTSSGTSYSNPGSTIRGLVINNFGWEAIIVNGNYNTVAGCYIGTNLAGTGAVRNCYNAWCHGILLNGNYNTIGGTSVVDRNVISGNNCGGLWTTGDDNRIQGNYFGVTSGGNAALANSWIGAGASSTAQNNLFSGNVISGNGNAGMLLEGVTSTISGNIIGLGADGNTRVGNANNGIYVNTSLAGGNIITGNVVSGNTGHGIVFGNSSRDNTVSGNFCGTNRDGTAAVPNTIDGIRLETSHFNTFTGNLCSGNRYGIFLNSNCQGNTISGNYVGTDITGTYAITNTASGIILNNGPYSTIVTGNLASGNAFNGIYITNSPNNTVKGNIIGLNAALTAGIPNGYSGICIRGTNGDNNIIGGTSLGDYNTIAYNTYYGIRVDTSSATGNAILGNSIYKNGRIGIDLTTTSNDPAGDGVTPNDLVPLDPDSGGNNLQNFPVISTATIIDSQLNITGSLNSTANSTFRIEFFSNAPNSIDSNDQYQGNYYGEGQTYIGYLEVTTNASGNVASIGASNGTATIDTGTNTFSVTFNNTVADGNYISATATKYTTSSTTVTTTVGDTTATINGSLTVSATGIYKVNLYSDTSTYLGYVDFYCNTTTTARILASSSIFTNKTITNTNGAIAFSLTLALSDLPSANISATTIKYAETSEFSQSRAAHAPGVLVTPTSGLITSEFGTPTASFSVVLTSTPGANVTITFTSNDTTEGRVSSTSSPDPSASVTLTFTTANWNTPQIVTVTGVDDVVEDGAITYIITGSASSTDPVYNNRPVADVSVTNADNDSPGFAVIPASGLTTTETAGSTATFQVLMNKQPTSDVTVNFASSNPYGGTVSPATSSLTFTIADPNAANYWNKPQTVTVNGVNNDIYGNIEYTINMTVAAGSAVEYLTVDTPSVSVTNIDNDTYNIILVDTTNDLVDVTDEYGNILGDYTVAELYANKGADGKISFREAIIAANNTANGPGGPDRIYFDLAYGSQITVAIQLPDIATPMIIDGNNGSTSATAPSVVVSGTNWQVGLNVISSGTNSTTDPGSTIRGLVINNFGWEGVKVMGNYNTVAGCYIGTDITGTTAAANSYNGWCHGIWLEGNYNTIGGSNATDRNVISGNAHGGLWNVGDYNTIRGNYFGLTSNGNAALGNGWAGMGCGSAAENTLVSNNVSSGNVSYGMLFEGVSSTVQGNIIGLGADGDTPIGNTNNGIHVNTTLSGGNTIIGNVVSANTGVGIYLNYSNDNVIQGNIIGLNAAGNAKRGNTWGINIYGSNNTVIGGTTAAQRNVISGNGQAGISISTVSASSGRTCINNIIRGNYIGTFADGTGSIATSGNLKDGINIRGGGQTISGNIIGGTNPSESNLIAFNQYCGVRVDGSIATGNPIIGNSIYSNGLLGINLTTNTNPPADGTVTLNGTSTSGGNNLQHFPIISTATASGGQMYITGTLNSTANSTFRIEFFKNHTPVVPDASGYGEGQTFIGYLNVTTNSNGDVISVGASSGTATMSSTNTFAVIFSNTVADGDCISATATKIVGASYTDTSEFAQNVTAHTPGIDVSVPSDLTTNEDGNTVQLTVVLHAAPTSNVTMEVSADLSANNTREGAIKIGENLVYTTSLTFMPSNWSTPQTVTVAGLMDYLCDGDVSYTVTIHPSQSSETIFNGLSTPVISVLNIDHVNLAPVITTPEPQVVNSTVVFSSRTENAIRIDDIDAGASPLCVHLEATNGLLTLGSTSDLTFHSGNGARNNTMEFVGSPTAVNTALEGMSFALLKTNGNIKITVNDQGNSGSGGTKTSIVNVLAEALDPPPPTAIPPALPAAQPLILTKTSTALASSAATIITSIPVDINPRSLNTTEQNGNLLNEAPIKNIAETMSIKSLLRNASIGEITSVDLSTDNALNRDKSPALIMQPVLPKLANDKLVTQAIVDTQLLWKDIKTIADASDKLPWLNKINVGTAIGVGAGLSAGYLMMAFRFGALLTSSLVTFPVWQWVDPLPILETSAQKFGKQKFGGDNEQDAGSPLDSIESLMS